MKVQSLVLAIAMFGVAFAAEYHHHNGYGGDIGGNDLGDYDGHGHGYGHQVHYQPVVEKVAVPAIAEKHVDYYVR